jgi:hypothetical protein
MKLQTNKPDLTLEQVEAELKSGLPELTYFYRNNLSGRHLIIQQSSTVGLGVWVKEGQIKIEELIPSLKIAMLMGAGVGLLFLFNKQKRADLRERVTKSVAHKYSKR